MFFFVDYRVQGKFKTTKNLIVRKGSVKETFLMDRIFSDTIVVLGNRKIPFKWTRDNYINISELICRFCHQTGLREDVGGLNSIVTEIFSEITLRTDKLDRDETLTLVEQKSTW